MKWPYAKTSCLEWRGLLDKDGYGRVSLTGRYTTRAHRVFYEAWHNTRLSKYDVLLHTCDNPKCFNPYHLVKGDQAANVKDMDAKGRRVSSNSFVTHCPYGHEYTTENTIVRKDGKRRCRTCEQQRRKK